MTVIKSAQVEQHHLNGLRLNGLWVITRIPNSKFIVLRKVFATLSTCCKCCTFLLGKNKENPYFKNDFCSNVLWLDSSFGFDAVIRV